MKQGYIKIPINEVWELINKPHRFYETLLVAVEKLPTGEYDLLNFDAETKKEILARIEKIRNTGEL